MDAMIEYLPEDEDSNEERVQYGKVPKAFAKGKQRDQFLTLEEK